MRSCEFGLPLFPPITYNYQEIDWFIYLGPRIPLRMGHKECYMVYILGIRNLSIFQDGEP